MLFNLNFKLNSLRPPENALCEPGLAPYFSYQWSNLFYKHPALHCALQECFMLWGTWIADSEMV